jgi:hypothetical protein
MESDAQNAVKRLQGRSLVISMLGKSITLKRAECPAGKETTEQVIWSRYAEVVTG